MREKKQRPLFSPHQIQTMEKEFAEQRCVTEDKRAHLASKIDEQSGKRKQKMKKVQPQGAAQREKWNLFYSQH